MERVVASGELACLTCHSNTVPYCKLNIFRRQGELDGFFAFAKKLLEEQRRRCLELKIRSLILAVGHLQLSLFHGPLGLVYLQEHVYAKFFCIFKNSC